MGFIHPVHAAAIVNVVSPIELLLRDVRPPKRVAAKDILRLVELVLRRTLDVRLRGIVSANFHRGEAGGGGDGDRAGHKFHAQGCAVLHARKHVIARRDDRFRREHGGLFLQHGRGGCTRADPWPPTNVPPSPLRFA